MAVSDGALAYAARAGGEEDAPSSMARATMSNAAALAEA